jgi:4-amino-4-deoxy-L-arabinose transferase-like glycosyltransferase
MLTKIAAALFVAAAVALLLAAVREWRDMRHVTV